MPHSTYFPERMGRAEIAPQGDFEAGSFQSFTLTYTAGYFGIDDTGSLKIVHRFASDMGRTQFIRVVRGFLREHDRIIVRFGDTRQGSPGIRMQTFNEPTFEFRVLVDAW